MSKTYLSENILFVGYNSFVRLGTNATDAKMIGFVDTYRIGEDFGLQEARVIGQFAPISIDAQAYNCNLSLTGYVPSKKIYSKIQNQKGQMGYSFEQSLMSLNPDAVKLMEDGTLTKFEYIDFVESLQAPVIMCQVRGLTIASTNLTVQSGTYAKYEISMRAIVGKK